MSGRDAILNRLRTGLKTSEGRANRQRTVDERLANPQRGIIPARAQVDHSAQVDLFCEISEKVQSTVIRVNSETDIPGAVSDYLRSRNLPQNLCMGADDRLENLPWENAPNLERSKGPSDGSDAVSLAAAIGGVAESGTLILTSGTDNPTTNNFLPETQIIVIDSKDITDTYETVFDKMRGDHGKGVMPRTVNMITGPSRSGDIEQTILLGAHGPRALHIIVVDGGE